MCKKRLNGLTICSWNARSLLEVAGDIHKRHGFSGSSNVEKNLICWWELEFRGYVAVVQEMK